MPNQSQPREAFRTIYQLEVITTAPHYRTTHEPGDSLGLAVLAGDVEQHLAAVTLTCLKQNEHTALTDEQAEYLSSADADTNTLSGSEAPATTDAEPIGPLAVEPEQSSHGARVAIVHPDRGIVAVIPPVNEDVATDQDNAKREPWDWRRRRATKSKTSARSRATAKYRLKL
jgi:hypothetical protein